MTIAKAESILVAPFTNPHIPPPPFAAGENKLAGPGECRERMIASQRVPARSPRLDQARPPPGHPQATGPLQVAPTRLGPRAACFYQPHTWRTVGRLIARPLVVDCATDPFNRRPQLPPFRAWSARTGIIPLVG